jgi:transposase
MDSATFFFAGIDWASAGHAVCVVDGAGAVVEAFEIAHAAGDLGSLARQLARRAVSGVGIERPDGPVVDALLEAGLTVYVIPSRQVKALRTRYTLAGHKSDASDAYVLADTLRTDRHRLRPLEPDSPATVALRAAVRARRDLVVARLRLAQQLGAHLDRVFPGAVGLFSELDSPISLAFLRRFPSASEAAWLSQKRLATWLKGEHYPGRTSAAVLYARLERAPAGVRGEGAAAFAGVTLAYVEAIAGMRRSIERLELQIAAMLAAHPDGFIFTSLPRAGCVRAAGLLAEFGDCRARFPTAESLGGLAGSVPSTRESGKLRVVAFRFSCDKHLRAALMDFAADSRFANAWADELYRDARGRHKRHPHAVRIVAAAWVRVIWRMWQDHEAYDPARHAALQAVLAARAA